MQTESFSGAIQRLDQGGFTHGLMAESGRLHDLVTGESFDPETLTIDEVVRFEGESDPDEQAILFALRSPQGDALGTYSAVFGPSMPPEDGDVVRRLGARARVAVSPNKASYAGLSVLDIHPSAQPLRHALTD